MCSALGGIGSAGSSPIWPTLACLLVPPGQAASRATDARMREGRELPSLILDHTGPHWTTLNYTAAANTATAHRHSPHPPHPPSPPYSSSTEPHYIRAGRGARHHCSCLHTSARSFLHFASQLASHPETAIVRKRDRPVSPHRRSTHRLLEPDLRCHRATGNPLPTSTLQDLRPDPHHTNHVSEPKSKPPSASRLIVNMPSNQPVSMTVDQAQTGISQELRNNIYSALLSDGGIRNIESTLDEQLRASGFKDELRRYITDLFRSGQATSVEEARNLAMDKIREQMRSAPSEHSNGANGVNGTSNGNNDNSEEYQLHIPEAAVREGTKTVMKELEKVCDITYEDDK